MVITVEIYKQIRKMRLDGMSQRQIAAVLRISRNTVKKYWDGDSVPWERKDYSREASVLTEDVVAFAQQCLDEDARNPRKLGLRNHRQCLLLLVLQFESKDKLCRQ